MVNIDPSMKKKSNLRYGMDLLLHTGHEAYTGSLKNESAELLVFMK